MTFYAIKRTPADKWFSYLIRFRDNWTCVFCSTQDYARAHNMPEALKPGPSNIECAHIFSRAGLYSAGRHDTENAVSLCHKCHDKFSHNSEGWERWCKLRLGQRYYLLKLKSKRVNPLGKYFTKELTETLKQAVIRIAIRTERLWIIEKDLSKKDLKTVR